MADLRVISVSSCWQGPLKILFTEPLPNKSERAHPHPPPPPKKKKMRKQVKENGRAQWHNSGQTLHCTLSYILQTQAVADWRVSSCWQGPLQILFAGPNQISKFFKQVGQGRRGRKQFFPLLFFFSSLSETTEICFGSTKMKHFRHHQRAPIVSCWQSPFPYIRYRVYHDFGTIIDGILLINT